jgi:hypothetical protein
LFFAFLSANMAKTLPSVVKLLLMNTASVSRRLFYSLLLSLFGICFMVVALVKTASFLREVGALLVVGVSLAVLLTFLLISGVVDLELERTLLFVVLDSNLLSDPAKSTMLSILSISLNALF